MSILKKIAKKIKLFLLMPEYRRFLFLTVRHMRTPRYTRTSVSLGAWRIHVPDVDSFIASYHEIFVKNIYAFRAANPAPLILDCGANIGLSILYFKKIYPDCRIVAYEADPEIFAILDSNIRENGISNVSLVNKGVWSTDGTMEFSSEGADGGRIGAAPFKGSTQITTEAFSSILSRYDYDFVKIDIEGAETEVLLAGDLPLERTRNIFVEFHSFQNKPQMLGKLLDLFETKGFRVHLHPQFTSPSPFLGVGRQYDMDMQLNLFFWRDGNEET